MNLPSIKQYEQALIHALSESQRDVLQLLMGFPESTASAMELAVALGYQKAQHIVASSKVGNTGKAIANFLQFEIDKYPNGEKMKPYTVVGEYFQSGADGKRTGWRMNSDLQQALINVGLFNEKNDNVQSSVLSTEEIPTLLNKNFTEGKLFAVYVNRYERNTTARKACIKHFKPICQACGFDFKKTYGELGEDYIHVHHKVALRSIGKEYKVDPINDLVPLCANCHAAIHLKEPQLTVEQLIKIVEKNKK